MAKFLNPEATHRMMELAGMPYRPKVIIDLRNEIEAETRAAELAASITNVIDEDRIRKIVMMKLRLDALYIDWAEGKIS